MGGHAKGGPIGDLDGRAGQVQGHDRNVRGQRGGQQDRHLVVLPGVQVDDVPFGEELGHPGLEDAEVGPAVLGGLGSRVAGDPEHLADADLRVLGELAEQAHRAVLQVREGAIGRAGRPEAVEVGEGLVGEIDRGDADGHAGVRELGDLLRQERSARVRVALVPAPAGQVLPVLGEAGDVGRFGEVGRAGDEQRAAVFGLGGGVDPRAP